MIARAPGKVLVSGAYAVLEGAPAIVAAVDRYVVADASREADLVTPEVMEAVAAGRLDRAPWFDASALRTPDHERKLGLGSSAAIVVASLAAVRAPPAPADERAMLDRLFTDALASHRAAQAGGSGVDVAASVYGGISACALVDEGRLRVDAHALPGDAHVSVFASPRAASTRSMLECVAALSQRDHVAYGRLIGRAAQAARNALVATSASELAAALDAQFDALDELGRAAGAPIVTSEVASLRPYAASQGASFGPSGAGGGDVSLFLGPARPSQAFVSRAAELGLEQLDVRIGARGVHWIEQ